LSTTIRTIRHCFAVAGFLVVCALPGPAPAALASQEDENAILGTAWGITLASDGTGFYNDVLYAVLAQVKDAKPYQPMPYRRAKTEFALHGRSCLYPSSISHLRGGGELDEDDIYLETRPVIFVESHLFAKPGTLAPTNLDDLAGKRIAYPNGSALPVLLEGRGAQFIPTTDETTKANMLIAGRVDLMSGSLPDNIFVFRALKAPLPAYNPDLPLARVGVGIVCHDTPANRAFIQAFDAAVASLVSSGLLAGLFGVAGVGGRVIPPGAEKK
jgi:hypothetical protein